MVLSMFYTIRHNIIIRVTPHNNRCLLATSSLVISIMIYSERLSCWSKSLYKENRKQSLKFRNTRVFLKQNNVACGLFSSLTRPRSDHKSIVIRIGGEGNLLSDDTKQYIIAHAQQINK